MQPVRDRLQSSPALSPRDVTPLRVVSRATVVRAPAAPHLDPAPLTGHGSHKRIAGDEGSLVVAHRGSALRLDISRDGIIER